MFNPEISMNDIYEYLQNSDKIQITQIQADIMEKRRKEYLDMHPYEPYEGRDGKWYVYIPDERKGRRKVKRASKKQIEDYIIEYQKERLNNPTLKEVFREWNDLRLERGKIAQSTYDRYDSVFRRHFTEFGNRKIKNITPEDIEDFLESEISRLNLTAKGFSNLKSTMIGILKRAKRRRLINFNITDLLEDLEITDHDFRHTIKEDYEEVFDENETAQVMNYCLDNLDMRNTGILLMFVTGLRVGELAALKHEDIKESSVLIRRTETRYKDPENPHKLIYTVKEFPKTKAGVREVAVPKDYQFLLQKLKLFNPFHEYIFVDKKGIRLRTNAFRKRIYLICNKLGIYQKSPHKVRKTVSTIFMDEKLDNNMIRKQMGWANIAVGENHYHRNRKTMEKKVEIVSGIREFQLRKEETV